MSDDLSLTLDEDVIVPVNQMNKIDSMAIETAAELAKGLKLNEEDRVIIEQNKDKKRESVSASSESNDLNEDEFKLCMQLQNDLTSFITKNTDIKEGDGNIEKIPTGIKLLDAILGGGLGLGTFTMIVGNPGTFKSALVAQIIAHNQKRFRGKFLAEYYDSESAMSKERLRNMGVKYPPIQPRDDVTIENIFKTLEAMFSFKIKNNTDYPGVLAWDSVANTSTAKERTTDNINETIGLKARLLSALMPRYVPKMRENNISLIAVNQLREKLDMGQFGAAPDIRWINGQTIPGGQALKFNAFHLLHLKVRGDLKPEQYGFAGVQIEAKCLKNKFAKPNVPIQLVVDFNTGVSDFWTSYRFLAENKRIQAGAWNKFVSGNAGLEKLTWRTSDAKRLYMTNEKGFKDEFDRCVEEALTNVLDMEFVTDDETTME